MALAYNLEEEHREGNWFSKGYWGLNIRILPGLRIMELIV
jgi:hypothetical protein